MMKNFTMTLFGGPMAQVWFHECRWWQMMVFILLSGYYCLNVAIVAEGYPFKSSSSKNLELSQISLSSELKILPKSSQSINNNTTSIIGTDVVIFLRDNCNDQFDMIEDIEEFVAAYRKDTKISVSIVPKSLTCERKSWGLEVVVEALGRASTQALIAALDEKTCEVAARLAHLWNKPLVTWTCPIKDRTEDEVSQLSSTVIRLSPSVPAVAHALAQVFLHYRWKTVAVVGTDNEGWLNVERAIVKALGNIGIVPRHRTVLSHQRATGKQIYATLRPLQTLLSRVIVLCLPLDDEDFAESVISQLAIDRDRLILLVYPKVSHLFLPPPTSDDLFSTFPSSTSSTTQPPSMTTNYHEDNNYESSNNISSYIINNDESSTLRLNGKIIQTSKSRFPSLTMNYNLPNNILAITPFDQRYDIEKIYNGSQEYTEASIVDRLNESLDILTRDNSSIDRNNNKMYTYGLLRWSPIYRWTPILQLVEYKESLFVRQLVANNFAHKEIFDVLCEDDNQCSDADDTIFRLPMTHIIGIILGSLILLIVVLAIALLIRRHLLNKRMSKGPYKIVLTASDFVFPQVPDSRRVDEGIEAMLCCWLQQLQEFGGPEVEKPDLLQGSVGSLKPSNARGIQTSGTASLVRHPIFRDPRARYNGDVVQLKELPCQQSTFELKSKAMDVLVMVHGLRHENLNPLIGCLTEPARPCLVSEYCSRGSLEDVLVQDEIKLDWSFRLSLLTDLVRGIKYLHSSPTRVHGYLTSRNCVIDARWVLKLTDYGLPAFYDAQNILPPAKTARDLLWTAPELLRHANLRKRGTQPGDVYSFGIIMQEVVVRGEPFCMLALSPEDIIEKVKKPPPLIRPSVSKGAAPPEAINIMRQCWAEAADMRPDFNAVHDQFKKLNHGRKVNFVDTMFQMLEKYSNNLEELIRERTEQLDMEKKKTEQLLNRMLPRRVIELSKGPSNLIKWL